MPRSSPRAIALAALLATAARAQSYQPAGTPYQLWPGPDAAVLVAGMTLWTMPTIMLSNQINGTPCTPDPCNPADVNTVERHFIPGHGIIPGDEGFLNTMRWVGNGLYALQPILWLGLEIGDLGWRNPKAFFTDLAIVAEAASWSGAIDEIFRRSVHRPRPYTYVANLFPERRVEGEAGFSYYSGHTAEMFVFATVLAYTWTLRHPGSPWRWPVWIGLMMLATFEGVTRLYSGDHFPTDVLTGGLMGSAIGVFFTSIHRKWKAPIVAKVPSLASLSLFPTQRDDVTTIWVGGRF